ncbi:MAG: hypothetical protein H6658_12355 [Ardenticatenaceae bacterium]|nr:hypothetical protein [Ardenticatenaceae bacterium]
MRSTFPSPGSNKEPDKTELRREIEDRVAKIIEIKRNLPEPESFGTSGRIFKSNASYFTKVGSDFITYTKRKKHPYYLVINNGDGPKTAAKSIIDSSKKVAKLFERYGKRPQSYSQVDSILAIDDLLAELDNLKFYC